MHNKAPTDRSAPSVRLLASASIVACALIAVLVAATLIRTSSMLGSATSSIVLNAQSWGTAGEAELTLTVYQRISNLYAVTADARLLEARSGLAAEMVALLEEVQELVSEPNELELVDAATRYFRLYLQEREALEAQSLALAELVQATQPSFDAAAEPLRALQELNELEVSQAHADAVRWTRIGSMLGAAAAGTLILGLGLMAFGLQRYVLRPILDLHAAISRYRHGAVDSRLERRGLLEVRELVENFNDMADALARQRENQLAFLAGIAHDLRNPLAGMRLGIQALVQEQSQTRRSRAYAALDRQVGRLARMLDDLLDATRIEAGKLEIRPEEFDLRDVVEDMIRLYAPTSPEHEITATMPKAPVLLVGDPLRVEQVVSNLISNAIKFSPPGGPIVVTVEGQAESVVLSVRDKGVGIGPDEQADIFLPFRRRRAEATPGVGLGLSVVRRIVDVHGGHIDVESKAGYGATFRVTLPRHGPVGTTGVSTLDGEHVEA